MSALSQIDQDFWAEVVRHARMGCRIVLPPEFVLALESDRIGLRAALVNHRIDLHQSSGRPCSTCRMSALALGGKPLGGCKGEQA